MKCSLSSNDTAGPLAGSGEPLHAMGRIRVCGEAEATDTPFAGFTIDRVGVAETVVRTASGANTEPAWLHTQARPWPIEVHVLGRFDLMKDGKQFGPEGKAQRKPLALLKALVALGGAAVPESKLIEIVWAETLQGDAQTAFHVTVHRLRKLLGHDQAIHVSDRRASLDPKLVWVDLWALDSQLAAVIPVARATVPDAAQLERAAPAILELYRGHFLEGEPDAAWLLPVRNRLNGRFQRYVMRLGEHWEATREWPRAIELYERAVELDPLAEAFYGRLMACLSEQGRRCEAIEVFRRCRQMLSVTLGIKPAESTEAAYRDLLRC